MLEFRKVTSIPKFEAVVKLLTDDVRENGGTASEIINRHGQLVLLTVCAVPWGTILINEEISALEALAWTLQEVE